MAEETVVKAESRAASGSGAARRLRRAGWLPGVINNPSGDSRPVRMNMHDFEQMLHHHAGEAMMVDVVVDDGQPKKVLLRELQHHPVTGSPVHVEFAEVSLTEKLTVSTVLELVGEPKGVVAGGVLDHILRDLEVECLPGDMVESIVVDVSDLEIGDTLMVGDLKVDPKLTVVSPADLAVAAVVIPRVVEEAEEEVVEGEEGAEPEVVGEEKDEGEDTDTEE